ncbi:hypothetical protein pdam_00012254 [Pocillopora damicornis]|uniref:Nucleoside-diphosphate kinase n=1 Tax=Pocillopora damicornis TaxID=46731 RepID=A0A3M6TJ67_POCDA|nr:hypothetical protein pdam_00012254 [Pocillopora damicornis]
MSILSSGLDQSKLKYNLPLVLVTERITFNVSSILFCWEANLFIPKNDEFIAQAYCPGAGKGTQCSKIVEAMNKSGEKKFLIDGFPRNEDNLQGWNRVMEGKADVKCVLVFECSEDECIRRILERGKSSGRADDNIESLRKRFNTHETQTMPIIEHYEKLGLVKKIQAIKSPSEVFEEVQNVLTSLG